CQSKNAAPIRSTKNDIGELKLNEVEDSKIDRKEVLDFGFSVQAFRNSVIWISHEVILAATLRANLAVVFIVEREHGTKNNAARLGNSMQLAAVILSKAVVNKMTEHIGVQY